MAPRRRLERIRLGLSSLRAYVPFAFVPLLPIFCSEGFMTQQIKCPRCGSRRIGLTHVEEGDHIEHAGAVCRNCGETSEDIGQAAPIFPTLDRTVGLVAIVLTILTAAGGMLI